MRPICVACQKEMKCVKNGQVVYHPYEHITPDEKAQETIANVTIINTDVLIEGSWKNGDIDFVIIGDRYQCPNCLHEIIAGFGEPMTNQYYNQDTLKKFIERRTNSIEPIKLLRKN